MPEITHPQRNSVRKKSGAVDGFVSRGVRAFGALCERFGCKHKYDIIHDKDGFRKEVFRDAKICYDDVKVSLMLKIVKCMPNIL